MWNKDEVQGKADAFRQMIQKDLGLFGILRVHGCTVYRIATRRIPAVGPIQHAIRRIEIQIDWLRKVVVKDLDVAAFLG